jgi:hypothetical protein
MSLDESWRWSGAQTGFKEGKLLLGNKDDGAHFWVTDTNLTGAELGHHALCSYVPQVMDCCSNNYCFKVMSSNAAVSHLLLRRLGASN